MKEEGREATDHMHSQRRLTGYVSYELRKTDERLCLICIQKEGRERIRIIQIQEQGREGTDHTDSGRRTRGYGS